jgi:hypothetical protein
VAGAATSTQPVPVAFAVKSIFTTETLSFLGAGFAFRLAEAAILVFSYFRLRRFRLRHITFN